MYAWPLDLLNHLVLISVVPHPHRIMVIVESWWCSHCGCCRVWGWVVVGEEEMKKKGLKFNLHVMVQAHESTRVKLDLMISTHESYYIIGLLLYNILHFIYQKEIK